LEKVERKQKLKVKEILDGVNLIDIKSFILQYSRKNKDFEIAFKSHFLSRIHSADQGVKYKKILEEIIRPKTARNNKIGPTAKRTITIILEDLVLQMNDCLSTESYTEAYFLIKEALEKIAYIQNRFSVKDIAIEKCRIQFLGGIDIIIKKDLAPAFRNRLEKELTELINKSYYYPKSSNLISVLNAYNVFIESDKVQIIEDLEKKMSHDNYLSTIKTIIELSHPFVDIAQKVLLTFEHKKIYEAINELIRDGKFQFVEFFIDNKDVQFKYNKNIILAKLANAKEDHVALTKCLNDIDLETCDIFLLGNLLDELKANYLKKEMKNIKSWIKALPDHKAAQLLARGLNFKGIIKLIKEKNDFEWMKLYDNFLIENGFQKQVNEMYLSLATNYIESHIGMRAQDFLTKLKLHLINNEQIELLDTIRKEIKKEFKHRTSTQAF